MGETLAVRQNLEAESFLKKSEASCELGFAGQANFALRTGLGEVRVIEKRRPRLTTFE